MTIKGIIFTITTTTRTLTMGPGAKQERTKDRPEVAQISKKGIIGHVMWFIYGDDNDDARWIEQKARGTEKGSEKH